jgi:hypothetical protein
LFQTSGTRHDVKQKHRRTPGNRFSPERFRTLKPIDWSFASGRFSPFSPVSA